MIVAFVDDRGAHVHGPFADATSFVDGFAAVKIGDAWGFIDTSGALVVEPRFATVGELGSGFAAIRDGGKVGYLDIAENRWLVEPQFDHALGFVGDYAPVVVGGEIPEWSKSFQTRPDGGAWGLVDRTGALVMPTTFGHIAVREGIALVNEGGRASGFGSPNGGRNRYVEVATGAQIGDRYGYASPFGEGFACVLVNAAGDDWRIIDRHGAEVGRIDPSVGNIPAPEPFSEGRAVVSPKGSTSHRSKYAFVTTSGEVTARDLGEARSFSDGMAAVNRGGEKVQGETRKGTWGFLALDGAFVTRTDWGETQAFSEGRGIVSAKRGYIVVDRAGETVFATMYYIGAYSNGLALTRRRADT